MDNLNMAPAYPEIFLAIALFVILLADIFQKDAKRTLTYGLSLGTHIVCAALSIADFSDPKTYTFNGMFVSDPMSSLLKIFSYIAVGVTLIYSRQYAGDRGMVGAPLGGEYYLLALFSLLGQMIMISGNNFLVIYLGLELMSLSLYALVALRRGEAHEAAQAQRAGLVLHLG